MKKILFIINFLVIVVVNAQIQGYNDLGVLMTNQNKQTTARTMSMKGAFGALGGDLSALSINPAGAAVFNYSAFAMTMGYNNASLNSNFYGTSTDNTQENFHLPQIGGVVVFENDNNFLFNKIAFGINYNLLNDFKNSWISKGNSIPTWTYNIFNTADANVYNVLESQEYKNITSGSQSELNFTMAADINNTLYIGGSFNSYDFNFIEDATRSEIANDGNGHSVDAFESFWQEQKGNGFSMSAGFIYKPIHNLRLGLSYTSPVWYEVHEESNMFKKNNNDVVGYYDVLYSVDPPYYNDIDKISAYDYQIKTPSKLTGSIAVILDKTGIISADVTRQNYKGIYLNPKEEFTDVNPIFDQNLRETYALNLGTEWRIEKTSMRGGYSYAQSPYINAFSTANLQGYSIGLGHNFGNYIFDLAYDFSEQTGYYNYYTDVETFNIYIKGAELSKKNNKLLATLTYKF
jgi:hypothetical protein